MKKILLVCSAGMSTSLLQASMNNYIQSKNYDFIVTAMPSFEAKVNFSAWDIVLLGPQVRFEEEYFQNAAKAHNIPVAVIPSHIYALAKGKETVELVLSLLKTGRS